MIEVLLGILWKVAKDYLKVHQQIDLDAFRQKIESEIINSLRKKNLEETWKNAKNKGAFLKQTIVSAIKKHVILGEKESKGLDDELQKKTNAFNEFLKENKNDE